MPPEVRARVNKSLACWPVPPKDRCHVELMVAEKLEKLAGLQGYSPWPEASRIAAAAAEAEGFAAASAYAASKSLATDEERFDVFRTYIKEMWLSAYRYAKS
jgi:hypothetical protein